MSMQQPMFSWVGSSGITYPNMVLGLHFDGNWTDSSTNNATVTPINTAGFGAGYFGANSASFAGPADGLTTSSSSLTGRPHITIPSISDYDFHDISVNGTISFFIKFNALSKFQIIMADATQAAGSGGLKILFRSDNRLSVQLLQANGVSRFSKVSSTVYTSGVWYHIAITFSFDGTKRVGSLYTNGVVEPGDANQTVNSDASTDLMRVGCGRLQLATNHLSLPSNILMDDLIIQRGVVQWTSNFTPPALTFSP